MRDALETRGISTTPPRPTLKSIRTQWRKNKTVDPTFLRGQFQYRAALWDYLFAVVSPEQSAALVRRVTRAFQFDWSVAEAAEKFEKKFAVNGDGYVLGDTLEQVFRSAIRPWPRKGWKGVEVGNIKFRKTPHDLYRLLYLCKPVELSFDDMYGNGLFGITSPCHQFAMQFYLHKYELAAYELVLPALARGIPHAIQSGIPGADNGVKTTNQRALLWFDMVTAALNREWDVYPGNNFIV